MGYLLLLVSFFFPLLDLWILLLAGDPLPLISLFAICGLTGVFGLWLIQKADFSLWTLLESEIQNGRMPTEELLDAILILICGIALLLPGFITDAIGFALLIPIFRDWIIFQIRTYLKKIISF